MSIELTYRTEDGEVFNTLEEAQEHESYITLWNQIQEEFGYYGEIRIQYLCDFKRVINYIKENKQ